MKNLNAIWEDYLKEDPVSAQTFKNLIWHIENDAEPSEAILMATDMIIESNLGIKELAPSIAKHLDNEDDYVREVTVGCIIGRIKLSEYAGKAFDMAKNDPESNVRALAATSLGAVINKVNLTLGKDIAIYLYDVMTSASYDDLHKECVYGALLEAMDVPFEMWPAIKAKTNISGIVDVNLLNSFKKKYNI